MKKIIILLLLISSIKGLSQEKKDSLGTLKLNELNSFEKKNSFQLKFNHLDSRLIQTPHHKKVDFNNSNFPTYNYDIYNPNKSSTVIDFVLSGITNLF